MTRPKIAAHFLVKDEEDVIGECLDHAARFCDHILVLDNGSSDRTYEICKAHPRVEHCEQLACTYSDALRNHLLEASKRYLTAGLDWFVALSADHFFDTDLRQDVLRAEMDGADVITYDVAQYYLTDKDRAEANRLGAEWLRRPVEERIRYYTINYFDFPVALRYQADMAYKDEVTEWPVMESRRVASFKPVLKHYQFRSFEQLRRRLELRKAAIREGFKGFRHYRSFDWQDYVFDSDRLHHWDGSGWNREKKPTLDDLLGYSPPLSLRLKRMIKKALAGKR
jgi:glycosyltransferase involved in cell wall biosynthesis